MSAHFEFQLFAVVISTPRFPRVPQEAMVTSSIVFAGIVPHPPIMVPEVGGSAIAEVSASINAMKVLAERVIASGAETVVIISPHAPLEARAFVAYYGERLHGSFSGFGAPESGAEASLDKELLSAITQIAMGRGHKVVGIKGCDLDHGTTVPLYFLQRNGWQGRVVCLGYTFLSNEDHLSFGSCIRSAIDMQGRPVAVIASGDLSHRLKPGAPAGFNEVAHFFDLEIVSAIRECAPTRIVNVDCDLRSKAGECGYRSMLVALGATDGMTLNYELLSYEAPFGVGYMVAQLTCELPKSGKSIPEEAPVEAVLTTRQDLAALARTTVETFVREGRQVLPADSGLDFQAACFVSIKTASGNLRGCVGTVEATRRSLEEELIANAINAATRDPRFPPVTSDELPNLRYSVDVLSEIEPTVFENLDPKLFGVVVEEEGGSRRGVLLPGIEGVDSVEQQVAIATRKAGIEAGSVVRLFRFRVSRFRESDQVK